MKLHRRLNKKTRLLFNVSINDISIFRFEKLYFRATSVVCWCFLIAFSKCSVKWWEWARFIIHQWSKSISKFFNSIEIDFFFFWKRLFLDQKWEKSFRFSGRKVQTHMNIPHDRDKWNWVKLLKCVFFFLFVFLYLQFSCHISFDNSTLHYFVSFSDSVAFVNFGTSDVELPFVQANWLKCHFSYWAVDTKSEASFFFIFVVNLKIPYFDKFSKTKTIYSLREICTHNSHENLNQPQINFKIHFHI